MSRRYPALAFTDGVRAVQHSHGSDTFYDRKRVIAQASPGPDPMTEEVVDSLAERDGFYLATVSETGWPYVQFRGGPRGFVHTIDQNTIAWADFRGNLQYISTGNLAGEGRVAIIAVDYPSRRRIKIFGRARTVTAEDDPALMRALADPSYDAVVERAVVVDVEAFDWNCPQHITPRFSAEELEPALVKLHDRIATLEAENAALKSKLANP